MIFKVTSLILLILSIHMYFLIVQQKKALNLITDELSTITKNSKNPYILINTTNKTIKRLVLSINNVLNDYSLLFVDRRNTESSMKKMLSNISHDLKTPLTVIMGYSEILSTQSNSLDSEYIAKLHQNIHNKSKELLSTINSFFNLAKLEAGDIDLKFEKINLTEKCRQSILEFYDVITAKKINVIANFLNENIYVFADDHSINRILNNIISNAIRYGSDGNELGIQLTHDDSFATIEIWDRGKGIADKEYDRIFERLYTLEDSRNKNYQGNGLGLCITKKLVELMNGKIDIKSSPYKKTSFYISFPKL